VSASIDSIKTIVSELIGKGVEYAVGLYPYFYSFSEHRYENVIATLEPAFGRDVAKKVYHEIERTFKDVNWHVEVRVEDWEGSLYEYFTKHVLKELTSKPILEEVEKRLNQAPEKDIKILSITSASIKASEYRLVLVDRDEEGFLKVVLFHGEMPFLKTVMFNLGSSILSIRPLFYRYLLGFQGDFVSSESKRKYMGLTIYPFTIKYVERLASEVTRYARIPDRHVVESRIYNLYVKDEFLKLAIIDRSTRFVDEPSEFLSYFSGVPYELLCRWVDIEGVISECFVNMLVIDHVRTIIEILRADALARLMRLFRDIFYKVGYRSSCTERCCFFTKPLVKPVYMCFSPWPEDVTRVEKPPGSVRVMVVQGMPSWSILEYLEKRSRDPMWEGMLWLFREEDRVAVASNTYRDEDHSELLEVLSRNFNVMFIGPTPKESASAQKPVTVAPPAQQQAVVERRFDSELLSVKPSREVLEGVVARVLRGLGFNVQTNVRLPARGGEVEVDVWAFKSVGGSQFRVCVSCKNWDRDVDRHVVDQEFGRILQLDHMPHLRILVVRSLTEPARKAALDDGFMVIELGRKADAENARDIYEAVYRAFDELFTAIAPPRLREIAEKLSRGKGEPEEGLESSSTRA
jgi:hypothetical protein